MTAAEKLEKLQMQIEVIKEKCCENCQAWSCDNCWAVWNEDDENECAY